MAEFSVSEEFGLEELLQMGSGYVLDFSNASFRRFVFKCTGIDVYDENNEHYRHLSKANILRTFWSRESSYLVARLTGELINYYESSLLRNGSAIEEGTAILIEKCRRTVSRIESETPIENIEAVEFNKNEKNFSVLASSIRESIAKNQPEVALDRLHTFTVRYLRFLCDKYGIWYDKETPLHSLFGGYIRHLKENNKYESVLTERILKSSISLLEAFNDVRNNRSLSHDNELLSYDESNLIVSSILGSLKFIQAIEGAEEDLSDQEINESTSFEDFSDDIPF